MQRPTIIAETERYVLMTFGAERIITDKMYDIDFVENSDFTGWEFENALREMRV